MTEYVVKYEGVIWLEADSDMDAHRQAKEEMEGFVTTKIVQRGENRKPNL